MLQFQLHDLVFSCAVFERVKNFKYLGVIINEANKRQIDLQERIKTANKTYFMLQRFFRNKNTSRKQN